MVRYAKQFRIIGVNDKAMIRAIFTDSYFSSRILNIRPGVSRQNIKILRGKE